MTSEKILEMLHDGKIEELEKILQNEIYKKSLKNNGSAAKRYKAMERYFKTLYENQREEMSKPCKNISVFGKNYTCFIDGYCIVLTTESIGNIEEYDNSNNTYFDVEKMVDYFSIANETKEVNISEILANAKSKGYKYKKCEYWTGEKANYLLKINDCYVKIGLLDKAFLIINDGNNAELYYINRLSPILIKNELGIALVLPININETMEKDFTIINA